MKMNQWTVVLAAAGVVSLASAAKAEEKPSTVMTALSSTTLSGYVDTSAQWNFGTGNANVPPYKFNSPSKADGFNLDVIQLRLDKPLDETSWAAGYRIDLWAGPDANTLGTQSVLSGGKSDFAIRQAYVALRTPFVDNGIEWKMGVFDSVVGYESIESGSNPNYTRSYGHSIEPQTHTGLVGTYHFSEKISASLGVANTVGPMINSRAFAPVATSNARAESYKTYMASVQATAPDCWGFLKGSTFYGGVVNGFNNGVLGSTNGIPTFNAYLGATFATPVDGLTLGLAWDFLNINSTTPAVAGGKLEADIWSLATYASFKATEKLSFHARFEYVTGDIDQPGTLGVLGLTAVPSTTPGSGNGNSIFATTATVQYDLWKNVLTRLEFRWDHLEHGNGFGGTAAGVPTANNAFILAANVIYKF